MAKWKRRQRGVSRQVCMEAALLSMGYFKETGLDVHLQQARLWLSAAMPHVKLSCSDPERSVITAIYRGGEYTITLNKKNDDAVIVHFDAIFGQLSTSMKKLAKK